MKRDVQEVLVCTMKPYFLYLPVTYAIGTDCFGLLKKEKYKLKERQAWPAVMQTDDGVRQILSSGDRDYKDVWFALCDPAELLKTEAAPYFRGLRVLATIVSSSAFWALNHNEEKCRLFSDLARFEKIIAYRAGTTSHGIATSILKYKVGADPAKVIIEVEAGGEQRRFENSGPGTLMISPSVDTIEWLLGGNRNFQVMLDIATTPEYSNVLTTALLARSEVVRDHPQLVQDFLAGIQLALNKIHERDKEALTFAHKSADYGDYAEQALNRAIRSAVIPQSIEVRKDSWLRAAEKHFLSASASIDPEVLKLKMQHAAEVYECCIATVAKENEEARECAKKRFRKFAKQDEDEVKPRWLAMANLFLGVIIGCGLAVLCFLGPLVEALIAVGVILAGWIIQGVLKLRFWSTLSLYHWVAMLLLGSGAITFHGSYLPITGSVSLVTGGILFWLGSFRTWIEQNAKNGESK